MGDDNYFNPLKNGLVKMKQNRLPVNYSIKNVIDSILDDNPKARKLTWTRKK